MGEGVGLGVRGLSFSHTKPPSAGACDLGEADRTSCHLADTLQAGVYKARGWALFSISSGMGKCLP